MRYLYIVIVSLFMAGCASKDIKPLENMQQESNVSQDKQRSFIYDLVNIPQDISYFTASFFPKTDLSKLQKGFEDAYFSVWNYERPKDALNSIKWPFYLYKAGESYGENLQPYTEEFFSEMHKNANFGAYLTLNKKALTIKHANIRSFPTIQPLFKDPSQAGEGFPFDYLQNSSLEANKPVFVSHFSEDKEWVYIFSSFTSGWLQSDEIVFLDDEYTDKWKKAQQVFIIKEGVPLYSLDGDFLYKSKIGMIFALIEEDAYSYTVLTVSSYKHMQPLFLKTKISKNIAHKGYLDFNKTNFEMIFAEVAKSKYGWGGIYEQRDCSSTLRDLFAPFGVWLPRNSFAQSKVGKVVQLESYSDDGKIRLIESEAIPFETFLYKQGHIALYIGTYDNEPVVFQNVWGIKTTDHLGKEGRIIIGKPVISTLHLGQYQKDYDKDADMLKNLKSINIFTK